MTIYFIRHGETTWNRDKICQGHKDSPLTPLGEQTAYDLGELLRDKGIEVIYSSDLGRCVQTAEIVNRFIKKEIIKISELRERDFGDLNGKTNEEVGKILDLSDSDEISPNGESSNQMKERVLKFIKSLPEKEFKNILLVTHEGGARAILSEYHEVSLDSEKCNTRQNLAYRMQIDAGKIKELDIV